MQSADIARPKKTRSSTVYRIKHHGIGFSAGIITFFEAEPTPTSKCSDQTL